MSIKLPHILQVTAIALAAAAGTRFPAHALPRPEQVAPASQHAQFEELDAISDPGVAELSGLARSRRHPELMWGIDDSGNPASLFAILPGKKVVGEVAVRGAMNHDWEDVAGFEMDGKPYLAIADTGDNFSFRADAQVIVVPEPEPDAPDVVPLRTLRFRWADGARDVEAIAVDVAGGRVLLADKGRHPPGLYSIPLAGKDLLQPQRIADFPDLIPSAEPRVLPLASRWRGTPTSMCLSDDGKRLVVLTYESVSTFVRGDGVDWGDVLKRPPANSVRLPFAGTIESIVLSADAGSAVLATESQGGWAHFWRWSPVLP